MTGPPAQAPQDPGARVAEIPRYRLLGRIASGGMGSVYLGVPEDDEAGTRLVAIKIIHEHLAENRMFVHMLLDEAHLAQRISHPNVVGIVDVGELEGRNFVVMPYIEGGTLSELARQAQGQLPIKHVVRVIIDTLTGLHAAHALVDEGGKPLHIVHRDVSPGNILVGTDGVARVIDFGVAKAASRMTHTAPGIVKGKFSYMAPEQALGEKVDHRADVFSAGVVLWTMLTGQRLFTGETSAHTIRNLMSAEVVPPSRVRPQVPKCFDEVCCRALQRQREKRYQSAAEMAEELYTAAIIAEVLSPPEAVATWVQETLATRIARRRETIAQRRAQGRQRFVLDVGDIDRESFQTTTPLTPSEQGHPSSSSFGRPAPAHLQARGSAERAAAAEQASTKDQAGAGGSRWGRMVLWTVIMLAALAAGAVALRDRLPAFLPALGNLDWSGTPAAPRATGAGEPPAAPEAASEPAAPIIIQQPVIIEIPGSDVREEQALDAGIAADAAQTSADAGADAAVRGDEADEARPERRKRRSRRKRRRGSRSRRDTGSKPSEHRRKAEKEESSRKARTPAVEIEDNPYLDE